MFTKSKANQELEQIATRDRERYNRELQQVATKYQGNTIESLYWNANANNIDQVIKKLEAGVDVDGTIDNGETALHAAVFKKYLPLVKLLLEKYSANPNIANERGQTAYDLALLSDYLDNDPDAQERCRLFHWTCEPVQNAIEIIGLLRRHGAVSNKDDIARHSSIYENAIVQWESKQNLNNRNIIK